jgi:hypothetical protein
MKKHLLRPDEHPDEDAPDTCPICARDLTDDGDCHEHGGETQWRRMAEESRQNSLNRAGFEL